MHRRETPTTPPISTSRPSSAGAALVDTSLGRALHRALARGWEEFMSSNRSRALCAFAALLDGPGHTAPDGLLRLPHPAYDVAALYIGVPFVEELRARGLVLDSWFPGDVDRSEEIPLFDADLEGDGRGRIGARAFRSSVLRADGSVVCEIAVTFWYLKGGFGFPRAPSLSMVFASASASSAREERKACSGR